MHKKNMLLSLCCLLCSTLLQGQTWKPSLKGERNFTSVFLTSPETAFAVYGYYDDNGIIKTTDAGSTWNETGKVRELTKHLGEGISLHDIFFVTPKTGFAVGSSGVILKTTDEGNTWKLIHAIKDPKKDNTLYSVHFIDENTGCTVGGNGILFITNDGGKKWNKIDLSALKVSTLNKVQFVSNQVAYACGLNGVIKTTDGGKTWQITSDIYTASTSANDLHFFDENSGFVLHSAGVVKTTDGGKTWQQLPLDLFRTSLYSCHFFNLQRGWIVGEGCYVAYTEDGGKSWKKQDIDRTKDLFSIHFATENAGIAVGYDGLILKYTKK